MLSRYLLLLPLTFSVCEETSEMSVHFELYRNGASHSCSVLLQYSTVSYGTSEGRLQTERFLVMTHDETNGTVPHTVPVYDSVSFMCYDQFHYFHKDQSQANMSSNDGNFHG